uniref:Uncharacterized protein n=1 Tax=Candidozyma auris TaxID=498019 RepID=A0A0L0P7J3_CANAR
MLMATTTASTMPTMATILHVLLSMHVSHDLKDSAVDLMSLRASTLMALEGCGMYI